MFITKKYYFLLPELDPLLEKYPTQNSMDELSSVHERKLINLPKTSLNQNSIFKKEIFYILMPEFLPLISNDSILGLVSLIRPEFSKRKLMDIILSIKDIFRKHESKFKKPALCFFLILQVPTISHYRVLQKISLLEDLIKNLNREFPQILLFPKFIDSGNALWPVIIKDVKWLSQFQGNVDIQNKQFLKLLDSSQYEELKHSKLVNLPGSQQLMTARNLCFGCRKPINNDFECITCDECGAIICTNCLDIFRSQPAGENLCPGNIFAGINFHVIDVKQK